MTAKTCKTVIVPQMSLSLTGVPPDVARQVAADLPRAVQQALATPPTATNQPMTQTDTDPAAITGRLAQEIAGRLHAGLTQTPKGGAT